MGQIRRISPPVFSYTTIVPEPASVVLLTLGMIGSVLAMRRRKC